MLKGEVYMAGVSGNRRTLYTKKVIKESLIELLETREIHQVTVTDICKKLILIGEHFILTIKMHLTYFNLWKTSYSIKF